MPILNNHADRHHDDITVPQRDKIVALSRAVAASQLNDLYQCSLEQALNGGTISKLQASDLISAMLLLANGPTDRSPYTMMTLPPSPEQIGYIRKLSRIKGQDAESMVARAVNRRAASNVIGELINLPPMEPEQKVTEDGIYRTTGGAIYMVQFGANNSRELYAKKLLENKDAGRLPGSKVTTHKFVYIKGAIHQLRASMKLDLTPELALEFGSLYGVCFVCGRILTDEDSKANGTGRVCGNRLRKHLQEGQTTS